MRPQVAILAASQQLWWMWQTPVLLQAALQCGSLRKFRQPEVGTPLRQRLHLRSFVLFASLSTTHRDDRDLQQRDTPASVTSFVATSGPFLTYLYTVPSWASWPAPF
uniref:Secreted protein n=1 Tax=Ixodes ricinus TaxID=34613 RepID=A0A147BEC2_IXORI